MTHVPVSEIDRDFYGRIRRDCEEIQFAITAIALPSFCPDGEHRPFENVPLSPLEHRLRLQVVRVATYCQHIRDRSAIVDDAIDRGLLLAHASQIDSFLDANFKWGIRTVSAHRALIVSGPWDERLRLLERLRLRLENYAKRPSDRFPLWVKDLLTPRRVRELTQQDLLCCGLALKDSLKVARAKGTYDHFNATFLHTGEFARFANMMSWCSEEVITQLAYEELRENPLMSLGPGTATWEIARWLTMNDHVHRARFVALCNNLGREQVGKELLVPFRRSSDRPASELEMRHYDMTSNGGLARLVNPLTVRCRVISRDLVAISAPSTTYVSSAAGAAN